MRGEISVITTQLCKTGIRLVWHHALCVCLDEVRGQNMGQGMLDRVASRLKSC